MWFRNILIIGLFVFLLLSFWAGFRRTTKFRTKKAFSSGWFLFITLLFLWSTGGNMEILRKGILFGAIICAPFCVYEKRWIDQRIIGTTREQRILHELRNVPIIFLFILFWKHIVEPIWPCLGFFFALFLTQVYTLHYVIKLEKDLGAPILENEKQK